MSINSINSMLGMTYPYMNTMQNMYLGNYGYINSLSGLGYGNLMQTVSLDNAESFAKVLEKISEKGNSQNETKTTEQKTQSSKEGKAENTIPMTMVSRNIPRIQVVNSAENIQVKKMNPYVTISYKKWSK